MCQEAKAEPSQSCRLVGKVVYGRKAISHEWVKAFNKLIAITVDNLLRPKHKRFQM